MAQANTAKIADRVNEVYKMMLGGANRQDILDHAKGSIDRPAWNVTTRQVDTYIRRAKQLLERESDYRKAAEFGKALNRLNTLYARAMRIQDYRTALNVQKELNTLLSLYKPPAPQTLQILGLDTDTARKLAAALEQHGMNAADVFNAMLAELATSERKDE